MKALTTKILSIVFIFALITGCASSVTDAGLNQSDAAISGDTQIAPPNPDVYGDTEVKPIVPKPDSGE